MVSHVRREGERLDKSLPPLVKVRWSGDNFSL